MRISHGSSRVTDGGKSASIAPLLPLGRYGVHLQATPVSSAPAVSVIVQPWVSTLSPSSSRVGVGGAVAPSVRIQVWTGQQGEWRRRIREGVVQAVVGEVFDRQNLCRRNGKHDETIAALGAEDATTRMTTDRRERWLPIALATTPGRDG